MKAVGSILLNLKVGKDIVTFELKANRLLAVNIFPLPLMLLTSWRIKAVHVFGINPLDRGLNIEEFPHKLVVPDRWSCCA